MGGLWFFSTRSIEKPKYSVLEKKDGYEIRQYEPYIIAYVEVEGGYREALNKGFRLVADFIFGNNKSNSKIAMTSPVQEMESEKIAMTSPVIEGEIDDVGLHTISFVMPSKYTLDTIPVPNNEKVFIKEVPERKVAVLSYSWYPNDSRIAVKKQKLINMLENDSVEFVGKPESAFYNPPFTPPFMLRNEVLIEIK
ncbi:heme-binding protein [Candidatus Campbellbacteria bacterium CG22_combo_CG10-13_8_21_14_all_36_13]|uniref:Heme-binding protein n=1 Tax=Candidatus Campbellbacteria bacterium CG22_combo_CG10-13_8_21_14_all_36_13 TaxID=1974529 RepID=A0A2H0DYN2_9BACT|nr:MAG: heme-binding protein [Candidatus Campbellbacteria bacterium CG22_combo_CG10-13_8_21_14_all_36_13]